MVVGTFLLLLLASFQLTAVAADCLPCVTVSDCVENGTEPVNSSLMLMDCVQGQCTNAMGLLDVGCDCGAGTECATGRCDGTIFSSTCQELLMEGSLCNEDSDCLSGDCSLLFQCVDRESSNVTTTPTPAPSMMSSLSPTAFPEEEFIEEDDNRNSPNTVALLVGILVGVVGTVALIIFCVTGNKSNSNNNPQQGNNMGCCHAFSVCCGSCGDCCECLGAVLQAQLA